MVGEGERIGENYRERKEGRQSERVVKKGWERVRERV